MSLITTYLIPFVILLGVLVFVHESGHFLVAKFFKIKVERFSIGFGPRIFGKKIGDTEYRVAWIPLGGYVKMAGDDPTDDAARELPGSFLGAAVWKRMLVVLAGPAVNLVLPILILTAVFMVGKDFMASAIGTVGSGTPAAKAGLEAGDLITAVDGHPVKKWEDMTELIRSHQAGEKVRVTVDRDGKVLHFTLVPEMHENLDEFGIKTVMPIIGIAPSPVASTIEPLAGSPAAKAGLQVGDLIKTLGKTPVVSLRELRAAVATLPAGPVQVTVERRPPANPDPDAGNTPAAPKTLTITLDAPPPVEGVSRMQQLGFGDAELIVSSVAADSPAEHAGVQPGDKLLGVDDTSFAGATDYGTWLQWDEHPKETQLHVLRGDKEVTLAITPVMKSVKSPASPRAEEFPWDGIALWSLAAPPKVYTEQYSNPLAAIAAGVRGTGEVIDINVRAFSKIFHHEISVRDSVGGPIRIAQVAGAAAKAGPGAFIEVMIHLSVILGILNLLPIPVLDGGHFAFFAAEAVLRRPPSLRVREVAQQVGMLLLLAVMVFVMVNDVVTTLF